MHRSRLLALLSLALLPVSHALAQGPNALTEAEKSAGWELMFDGKTLTGWHSFRKTVITDNGWIVKDSAIYMRGPAAGALLAPEAFVLKNFEISIDWKMPDSGNSGIFLRYLETEDKEAVRTGPETQICGKLHPDYQGGTAVTSPGACYAMYAPAQPWIRAEDEYNTLRVIMYENKVAHFGNGVKLLEYVIGDPDWTARYDSSKYRFFPLYGDIHAGKLMLQDHASHVWYRNVKIRPLASDPWSDPAFPWPDQIGTGLARQGDGARGFRLRVGSEGRLILSRGRDPGAWDMSLSDPLGRVRGTFSGEGPSAHGAIRVPAGCYLLSGTRDGSRGVSGQAVTLPRQAATSPR
jgi:hypothetical protein